MVNDMEIFSASTQELEQIIEDYPWFTLARKVYIQKFAGGDKEKIIPYIKDSSLFLLSRIGFLNAVEGAVGRDFSKPYDITALKENKPTPVVKPRPYIVGGDYFSKEDFQQLSSEGLAINVDFSFTGKESPAETFTETQNSNINDRKDVLITETLAEIYADQGLYSQAIEIYQQLILLYPEKNVYFASLIENIKNKL